MELSHYKKDVVKLDVFHWLIKVLLVPQHSVFQLYLKILNVKLS